jgi:hypothetical protein
VITIATEEIYSKKIACGKRTYFFNLKEQDSGTLFVDIVESQYNREADRHQRIRMVIFEDHIDTFLESLREIAEELKKARSRQPASGGEKRAESE